MNSLNFALMEAYAICNRAWFLRALWAKLTRLSVSHLPLLWLYTPVYRSALT